ncbi:MAG: hypothetical protein HY736_02195 [Verrucomicrobia bacterium]|nr:hypothetical protein [Verrucomicrobiota bacterium]
MKHLLFTVSLVVSAAAGSPFPGPRRATLELASRDDVWDKPATGFPAEFVRVPRDQVVGFAPYTRRIRGDRFRPPVFAEGSYTVKAGRERPDLWKSPGVKAEPAAGGTRHSEMRVTLGGSGSKR